MSVQTPEHPAAPPTWALQRVATAMGQCAESPGRPDAKRMAQKTGMSKSLARRCLIYLATRR